MKKFMKQFRYGEKGFTLIELLVVITILGVIAAVAVPNVGKFIGQGKEQAYAAELHNVQTAVMAMLTESASGELDAAVGPTTDMATVLATSPGGTAGDLTLSSYMTGLGDDPATPAPAIETTCVKLGCEYTFDTDGTVTQTIPSP